MKEGIVQLYDEYPEYRWVHCLTMSIHEYTAWKIFGYTSLCHKLPEQTDGFSLFAAAKGVLSTVYKVLTTVYVLSSKFTRVGTFEVFSSRTFGAKLSVKKKREDFTAETCFSYLNGIIFLLFYVDRLRVD